MYALRLATIVAVLFVSASLTHTFSAARAGPALPQTIKSVQSAPDLLLVKKRCGPRSMLLEGKCIKKSDAASYCGPGYRVSGDKCVPGANEGSSKTSPGCPSGQVWSAQEGCHYDD
ncbi:MAG: hypothetical protein KDJ72_06065 [Methyloceanibacter sp.]|uniref:hypothetical protein n=1 Tax=Methyloceanibacter sp. TaxID=1965321 RepID=UPI001DF3AE78|nr:hypothetical protein [Methyloceanibacter sp.]MCB1442571.1 hypothetical protein [Methyloceanibacter sp.]